MQFINFIKDRISALFTEESGQDGIEYLLVIGGISVAIIVAALPRSLLVAARRRHRRL